MFTENTDLIKRSSGLLLHISSLPGKYGIGTLGQEAVDFLDFLQRSGQKYWQILPTTPTLPLFSFSPYSCYSSFAGDPLLISETEVLEESWSESVLAERLPDPLNEDFINFPILEQFKIEFLREAYRMFLKNAPDADKRAFKKFKKDEAEWIVDFAIFASIAQEQGTFCWQEWQPKLRKRDPDELKRIERELSDEIDFWQFTQFLFFRQWQRLLEKAEDYDISIIGDIPIYVNFDSADTWANPEIFQLNEKSLKPRKVSGVPPDYFSEHGQKWGNPLYQWFEADGQSLNERTYQWWKKRMAHQLRLVDIVRIDHFRGFESYWAVPLKAETAIDGKWQKGPGIDFFKRLESDLGNLPLIAEDLGIITKAVELLRDELGLPGMKILQFAFDFDPGNFHLPGNYTSSNCIVYTGTHDNNTTNGWFYGSDIDNGTREYILDFIGAENWDEFHWKLIRFAMTSTACLSVFPVQDVLGFSSEFRMNNPALTVNNWRWKLSENKLSEYHSRRLLEMTRMYNRYPGT